MLSKTRSVPARSSAPGAIPDTSSVPVSNGRPVTTTPPVTTDPNLAPVQASATANGSETSSTRPALRRRSAPAHPAQVSGPTPGRPARGGTTRPVRERLSATSPEIPDVR